MIQNAKTVSPMSNEGRNTYVIEHISDAMLSLLSNKPIEDISISELCERAGVGRASFYRNFDGKIAVVTHYLNQIFQQWLDENSGIDALPLSEQLGALFNHFEHHHAFYKLLQDRNMLSLLEAQMIQIYGPQPDDAMLVAYTKAYVAYALYGWVRVWFQRGMQDSAKEISELFRSHGL